MTDTSENFLASMAVKVTRIKQSQIAIGVSLIRRIPRPITENFNDDPFFQLELFDFVDNDQLTCLSSLLIQIGDLSLTTYLSDEFENTTNGLAKKLQNLFSGKVIIYMKKNLFYKRDDLDTLAFLLKLVGKANHYTNIVESERSVAFSCLEAIFTALRLRDDETNLGRFELVMGSINRFMQLDSAAADAVNLLPKNG